jgi:hypothetical protein
MRSALQACVAVPSPAAPVRGHGIQDGHLHSESLAYTSLDPRRCRHAGTAAQLAWAGSIMTALPTGTPGPEAR